MPSNVKGSVRLLAIAAALAIPSLALASDSLTSNHNSQWTGPGNLSMVSGADAGTSTDASAPGLQPRLSWGVTMADISTVKESPNTPSATDGKAGSADPVLFMDEAAPESPNIHGFFNSPFKTAYVTPRGLVVQNAGLVWQPVLGLVMPLGDMGVFKGVTLVGGIWNSVDTAESGSNPTTGAWDEMDVFVSLSATVATNFSLNLTYSPWNSPQHAFSTEHNADLKIGYDDSKLWGESGFALHPYMDLFWAISGSSTVILGRHGGTGYVEFGVAPSYTIKSFGEKYPLTLTVPIYAQVGPRTYWALPGLPGGNVGVLSGGLNASMPLAFIPAKYGFWHADLGVTYDYLANTSLLHAGGLASGNTNRNVLVGSAGFGFNF